MPGYRSAREVQQFVSRENVSLVVCDVVHVGDVSGVVGEA